MERKLKYGLFLMMATVAGHFAAVGAGLYGRGIPIDKAWHLFAGAAYVLFGSYCTGRRVDFWNSSAFSLIGSFAWEVVEFGIMAASPGLAYGIGTVSPGVADLLTDVTAGFVGGLLVLRVSKGLNTDSD